MKTQSTSKVIKKIQMCKTNLHVVALNTEINILMTLLENEGVLRLCNKTITAGAACSSSLSAPIQISGGQHSETKSLPAAFYPTQT